MDLYEAWEGAKGILKPQVQGDCGVYSFWYATVLLRQINPKDNREVIYPRCHTRAKGSQWVQIEYFRMWGSWSNPVTVTKDHSIRHMAKRLVNSGQGEILTCAEMKTVVEAMGYQCETHTAGGSDREKFITRCLAANRPVMFPYMKGDGGPISAIPPKGKAGDDYGSHWSLIVREAGTEYTYLDPHYPNTPVTQLKTDVLASNAMVDSYKYVRYWKKTAAGGIDQAGASPPKSGKYYDIGKGGRTQTLQDVLVAVY